MIRARREGDLARCLALLHRVYEADRYPVIWPADALGWLAGRQALAAWVAEEDEQLLGHLSLHSTEASRARPEWAQALSAGVEELAVVSRFFVAPEVRGRGVGGALLDRAEEHANDSGRRLVLDVATHNQAAIAFYAGRGWRRVGTTELALGGEPWRLPLVLFVLD